MKVITTLYNNATVSQYTKLPEFVNAVPINLCLSEKSSQNTAPNGKNWISVTLEDDKMAPSVQSVQKSVESAKASSVIIQCENDKKSLKFAQALQAAFLADKSTEGEFCQFVELNTSSARPLFIQLFDRESCTYTYIVGDEGEKTAVIVDTVNTNAERDVKFLTKFNDLRLLGVLETHVHADHTTGSDGVVTRLPQKYEIPHVVSHEASIPEDQSRKIQSVKDLDVVTISKNFFLVVRETQGHTNTCLSFITNSLDQAITGDALMVRGCGRTDFQSGSPNVLFHTIKDILFRGLPDTTRVYPGHDYFGRLWSTIGTEKEHNLRCFESQTEQGFVDIMDNLNLSPPSQMAKHVPANLIMGKE